MLARPPSIDWKAVIAALGFVVALLGWFTNHRENKKTSARQDAAEKRELTRQQRAVAEHVSVVMEGPHAVSVERLHFQIQIYNRSNRPIYDCTLEGFSRLSDAIQLVDERDPLSWIRNRAGQKIEPSDLIVPVVQPMPISEGMASAAIEFELRGVFAPDSSEHHSPQPKMTSYASVEVSFSDGSNRWLIDSIGTPPKLRQGRGTMDSPP